MSERRRSAFFGSFSGTLILALSLTRNIVLVPVYLHKIALAEYGAWLATGGALALILINDFGLSGVVTQRISTSYGARDFGALGGLTGSALAIGCILSLGLSGLSLIFVPFLPGLAALDPVQTHTVVVCFIFAIAANGVGVLGATAVSIIRSYQRAALAGSIMLAAEAANCHRHPGRTVPGQGLYAIAAGVLVRSLIITVAAITAVKAICARELGSGIVVNAAAVRDLIAESGRFFLSAVAIRLLAQPTFSSSGQS